MNCARIMLSALLIPLIMSLILAQGSVHVGGDDGLALLKNLTDKSPNLTNPNSAVNNTSKNYARENYTSWNNSSRNSTDKGAGNLSLDLAVGPGSISIGNGGKMPLKNLSNSTLNINGTKNSSGLWTWGGKPHQPHLPDAEDYFNYQGADIVKANRV
jgi:hypothetical protein